MQKLETLEEDDIEDYNINYMVKNVKSKNKKKIKYSDVCPTKPPVVPGIVIGVMNEIERRIPPLNNILVGYTEMNDKSNAILDSLIPNCKHEEDLPFTLYEEPVWVLFQVLQLFLDRLEVPAFCVDLNIASNEKLYNFPIKYNHGSLGKVTQSLDECLKKMRPEQVALLSFIMQKIQLWALKNVEYHLRRNFSLSKDQVYIESIDFFRSLLGPFVISLPEAHLRALDLRSFQLGESIPCQISNIFAIISCDVGSDYWHQKSIEVFNDKDPKLRTKTSLHSQGRSESQARRASFHWIK